MSTENDKLTTLTELLTDRSSQYGPASEVAKVHMAFLDILTTHPNWTKLTPTMRMSLVMIFNKVARQLVGNARKLDTWQDIAGYAQLPVEDMQGHGVTTMHTHAEIDAVFMTKDDKDARYTPNMSKPASEQYQPSGILQTLTKADLIPEGLSEADATDVVIAALSKPPAMDVVTALTRRGFAPPVADVPPPDCTVSPPDSFQAKAKDYGTPPPADSPLVVETEVNRQVRSFLADHIGDKDLAVPDRPMSFKEIGQFLATGIANQVEARNKANKDG